MSVNGGRKLTGILHDLSARIEIEGRLREPLLPAKQQPLGRTP
jgi:hypothetical protein